MYRKEIEYVLGIDTSAYTTSIAIVNKNTNEVVFNKRKILDVSLGEKGLRQQEAVFMHIKNIQEIFDEIECDLSCVKIVSVSSRPRNMENSYMPVFVVGRNYAKVIAKTLNCEYIEYSHQENHIAASLIYDYKIVEKDIMAVHLSGGTTEFLYTQKNLKGYGSKIVGGTKDITFGQLIDRIGVHMGFKFPCGIHMEEYLEKKSEKCKEDSVDKFVIRKIKTPKIQNKSYINLSGMENFYKKLYDQNIYTKEEIILSIFEYTKESIVAVINELKKLYNFNFLIISGGVIANNYIRENIKKYMQDICILIFPLKEYSSDNAIGTAFLPIIDRWHDENKTN